MFFPVLCLLCRETEPMPIGAETAAAKAAWHCQRRARLGRRRTDCRAQAGLFGGFEHPPCYQREVLGVRGGGGSQLRTALHLKVSIFPVSQGFTGKLHIFGSSKRSCMSRKPAETSHFVRPIPCARNRECKSAEQRTCGDRSANTTIGCREAKRSNHDRRLNAAADVGDPGRLGILRG